MQVKQKVGALEETLAVFRDHKIDLRHIESRPAAQIDEKADYTFYITTTQCAELVRTLSTGRGHRQPRAR
jgi:prephenate dehydratase